MPRFRFTEANNLEPFTYRGEPLHPVVATDGQGGRDAALMQEVHAAKRTKADGTSAPELRESALSQLSCPGQLREPRIDGRPHSPVPVEPKINAPWARATKHPNDNTSSGMPALVYDDRLMECMTGSERWRHGGIRV